jgi:hypothetical protein
MGKLNVKKLLFFLFCLKGSFLDIKSDLDRTSNEDGLVGWLVGSRVTRFDVFWPIGRKFAMGCVQKLPKFWLSFNTYSVYV